jgi:hypothetical protein
MKNNDYELGTTEQKLQEYILTQYKSIREFCMKIDRPYSTVINMLKRGLLNSSVDLVLYVTDRLNLDIDELLSGRITLKIDTTLNPEITRHEIHLIRAYRAKPEMQKAVDTLLGIERNGNIADDIEKTVDKCENVLNSAYTNKK